MTPFWRNASGVVLVVAAAVGGFTASRLLLEQAPPASVPPTGGPTPSEPPPPEYLPPSIPERLPEVTLPDLHGAPRALSEWQGRPLLVNFWATWCEPCRREIPLLRELRAEHASQDLEILGIAIDFRDPVAAYVRQTGIDYPILIADEDGLVPRAFGVDAGLPATVFANRQGRIVGVKIGELRADEARRLIRRTIDPDPRTSPQKVP